MATVNAKDQLLMNGKILLGVLEGTTPLSDPLPKTATLFHFFDEARAWCRLVIKHLEREEPEPQSLHGLKAPEWLERYVRFAEWPTGRDFASVADELYGWYRRAVMVNTEMMDREALRQRALTAEGLLHRVYDVGPYTRYDASSDSMMCVHCGAILPRQFHADSCLWVQIKKVLS